MMPSENGLNFFLSDCSGQIRFTYQELVEDLLGGQPKRECASETGLLYRQLVIWLGQIIRHQPQVRWPGKSATGGGAQWLQPVSDSLAGRVHAMDFSDSSDLTLWRNVFLHSNSQILLETSGSSGQPKQVWHSMDTLTQGLRFSDRHRRAIWGLTYPVDHLAGMQVLFQSLLNTTPIINLFGSSTSNVHRAIDSFSISHLSCTPTFLRMLLADSQVHPTIQRLTSGGERLDARSLEGISGMFPQARLTNIYASTEVGAILVSHDDGFVIPEYLKGKFRIVDGELWLHESLKVENRMNSSDSNTFSQDQDDALFWPTGDQVEVLSDSPWKIRFLSRCHEGFNVAGYRVDPVRLETIARTHPMVADARFYGIPNSVTEHLVACDLVATPGCLAPETREWQEWLRPMVARHELPRIVNWVSSIDTTDSGKVKRR